MNQLFPSEQDWARISATYDWEALVQSVHSFTHREGLTLPIEDFARSQKVQEWLEHLDQRVCDVRTSYVFLIHSYEQGFPDQRWFDTENGRYFPDLTERRHHENKYFFRYFSEDFFTRIFSAWDTLAHVVSIECNWNEKYPDFGRVVKKIERHAPDLHNQLKASVLDNSDFIKAHNLRKDIIHNALPGKVRGRITESQIEKDGKKFTVIAYGAGTYIPSAEIKDVVYGSLAVFAQTLNILDDYFKKRVA